MKDFFLPKIFKIKDLVKKVTQFDLKKLNQQMDGLISKFFLIYFQMKMRNIKFKKGGLSFFGTENE